VISPLVARVPHLHGRSYFPIESRCRLPAAPGYWSGVFRDSSGTRSIFPFRCLIIAFPGLCGWPVFSSVWVSPLVFYTARCRNCSRRGKTSVSFWFCTRSYLAARVDRSPLALTATLMAVGDDRGAHFRMARWWFGGQLSRPFCGVSQCLSSRWARGDVNPAAFFTLLGGRPTRSRFLVRVPARLVGLPGAKIRLSPFHQFFIHRKF